MNSKEFDPAMTVENLNGLNFERLKKQKNLRVKVGKRQGLT